MFIPQPLRPQPRQGGGASLALSGVADVMGTLRAHDGVRILALDAFCACGGKLFVVTCSGSNGSLERFLLSGPVGWDIG